MTSGVQHPRIGVIIGSVREGRLGEQIAHWVMAGTHAHPDADFRLIDLQDFELPVLTSPVVPSAAGRSYPDERVTRWSRAIDECDGFVFVTPEYNHSVPGGFKNAVDSLGPEWHDKAVAFVSYGADGGVRAVEHWRAIVANLYMVGIRQQVSLGLFTEVEDGTFRPYERRAGELAALLTAVVRMTGRLHPPTA
ncbi:NADPH-dependent FMN reductase [Calidifontibacter terrae]